MTDLGNVRDARYLGGPSHPSVNDYSALQPDLTSQYVSDADAELLEVGPHGWQKANDTKNPATSSIQTISTQQALMQPPPSAPSDATKYSPAKHTNEPSPGQPPQPRAIGDASDGRSRNVNTGTGKSTNEVTTFNSVSASAPKSVAKGG